MALKTILLKDVNKLANTVEAMIYHSYISE